MMGKSSYYGVTGRGQRFPVEPTARHRAMSVYELGEAVRSLAASELSPTLTACLAGHMDRDELSMWAQGMAEEISFEIDRCLIELERRTNLSDEDAESRDIAWRIGSHLSHVPGQLGVTIEVRRKSREVATSAPALAVTCRHTVDTLLDCFDEIQQLVDLVRAARLTVENIDEIPDDRSAAIEIVRRLEGALEVVWQKVRAANDADCRAFVAEERRVAAVKMGRAAS